MDQAGPNMTASNTAQQSNDQATPPVNLKAAEHKAAGKSWQPTCIQERESMRMHASIAKSLMLRRHVSISPSTCAVAYMHECQSTSPCPFSSLQCDPPTTLTLQLWRDLSY